MLDSLTQRLSKVVKTMRGQARLTEANTKEMLREVRLALLEADVALPVVREVLARIKADAMGEEVVERDLLGDAERALLGLFGLYRRSYRFRFPGLGPAGSARAYFLR